MGSAPVMGFCVPEKRDCRRSCTPALIDGAKASTARTHTKKLKETVFIVKVILELIPLNIHPNSPWVIYFICLRGTEAEAMCSIVCSAGCSQNTAGGKKRAQPLLCLPVSVHLRKYNHPLLPQLPAGLQTQAGGRPSVALSRHYRVCQRTEETAWRSSVWGLLAPVSNHTTV